MTSPPTWPISISTLAPVSSGAVLWRSNGQLRATVIVKATFALTHGGDMELVEPREVSRAEAYHRNSVQRVSDLAPYIPRADVVFTGHAHAPGGRAAPVHSVRLAVYRGKALVDKTLHIYGDRRKGSPEPFEKMHLLYERAFGGAGWDANPIGVGFDQGREPDRNAANIVNPADPTRSDGFGPISRFWPVRRRLLGKTSRKQLEQPIAELPANFDWTYYQCAPPDQRCELLHGDEWVVLDGLHPELPRLQSRLPSVRAAARVYGLGPVTMGGDPPYPPAPPAPQPVELVADTLHIDGDEEICSLTWRGAVLLPDESCIPSLHVVTALELPGQLVQWPDAPPTVEAPSLSSSPEPAPQGRGSVDMTIADPEALERAAKRPATPFQPASTALPQEPRFAQTMVADDQAVELARRRPAMPFQPGSPWSVQLPAPRVPSPPAPSPGHEDSPFAATAVPTDDEIEHAKKRAAVPFGPAAGMPARPPSPPTRPFAEHVPLAPAPRPITPPSEPEPIPPAPPLRPSPSGEAPQIARRSTGAVPVVNPTSLVAFTLPWQPKPSQAALAVVIKGTFDIVPGGPLKLRDETELPTGDLHAGDEMLRSVVYPSDFAPFKPKADITLNGHAYAPGGSSPASLARFRFGRGAKGFDRQIAVFGERRWQQVMLKAAPTEPRRFETIPIVYELSFGGPGFEANPIGRGYGGGTLLPFLEDPNALIKGPSDTPHPVGFGPIPMLWKARWSKLGTYGADWQKTRWPHFPEDFDWAFFQAAPPAQQLERVEGDEPFEIFGMHPKHPKLDGKLPGLAPRCFVQMSTQAGGSFSEIVLRLDTVTFDVDEMKVNLVWRGLIEVKDDDAPEVAELFLQVEPSSGPRADLAAARAKYLAAKAPKIPAVESPATPPAPANDAEPPKKRLPPHLDPIRREVCGLLARGEPLDGCDAAGADLSDLDFSGRSLVGVNFKDALLRRAVFTGADLAGAQLSNADLTDAVLERANLTQADLTGAGLEAARFDGADLSFADLGQARGEKASFREARGMRARFGGGTWTKARFEKAEIQGADFTAATIDEAVFAGAVMPEIRLYDARGAKVSFDGATLTEARADGVTLIKSSLKGVSAASSVWDGAVLDETSFRGAILTGSGFAKAKGSRAVFAGADLAGGRLGRAKLAGASFLKTNLMEASLEGADLTGADLRGANLHGAETWKAKLAGAQLELALVTQTKLAGRT